MMTQEEITRALMRKNAALRSGHKFIMLLLKDYNKKRIAGVEVVHAEPYWDDQKNADSYRCTIRGGELKFEMDVSRGGEFSTQILDSELNRRFLASHYSGEHWVIEDEKVRGEIEALFKEMAANAVVREVEEPVALVLSSKPEEEVVDVDKLSHEEIEELYAKLAEKKKFYDEANRHPVRPTVIPADEENKKSSTGSKERTDKAQASTGQKKSAPKAGKPSGSTKPAESDLVKLG